jgi:hypothetical protein
VKIDPSGKVDRTLQKGDTGIAVALWQQFLIKHGKMRHLSEDDLLGNTGGDDHIIGEFEDQTVEATKKYQQEKGLRVDGILGSKTYAEAAKEGFNGNEVEAALLLGFNRVNRSLGVDKVEIVFSPNDVAFKIDDSKLSLYEALERLKTLDGLG